MLTSSPLYRRKSADWDESQHPRDHGKFAASEGASGEEAQRTKIDVSVLNRDLTDQEVEGLSDHDLDRIQKMPSYFPGYRSSNREAAKREEYRRVQEKQRRGRKIGDTIDFVRHGKPPESGISQNHRDGTSEEGLSVYLIDNGKPVYTGWHFDIAERPAYTGKGVIVGWGSDGEPLVKPLSIKRDKKQDRKANKSLSRSPLVRKAGFTGTKTDALGREMTFRDGVHVPGNGGDATAHDQKHADYATQMKAKFGDGAHDKLNEMAAKIKASGDPQAEAKIAELGKVQAALGKGAADQPKVEAKPAEAAKAEPKHGLHAADKSRLIRYDNGKPTKIHDFRDGDEQTEENHFSTNERPGIIRSKDGRPLSIQIAKKEHANDMEASHGMTFRMLDQGDKSTKAIYQQFDAHLNDLGSQLMGHVGDMSADPDYREEVTSELKGHLEQAKRELTELYGNHGQEKHGEHAKDRMAKQAEEIDAHFAEAFDAIDSLNDDADEDEDATEELAQSAKDKIDYLAAHVHDLHEEHVYQLDQESEARDQAEEDEVTDLASELDDDDFEAAKKRAKEYNQASKKRDGRFVVSFDKNEGNWYAQEVERSLRNVVNKTLARSPLYRKGIPHA